MYTRSRRLPSIASLALLLTLAACGGTDQTTGSSPSGTTTGQPSQAASGAPSVPASGAPAVSQTDTDWGRIWDALPPGFPRFPGSAIAGDTSPDPVSATYSVANDDTAMIVTWMQAALENASFRTDALSGPLEDGSFVLEMVGQGDCRLQVSVVPMGGLTFVTARYGAACPAG
jgi:hypothetical protein